MPEPKSEHDLQAALSAPFDPREVRFKPQMVKQNRCLAIAYIDARLVMDRLDETVGVSGWQTDFVVLNDGSVVCKLKVHFPGSGWIEKQDVGSLSEQPDAGDRLKSAFSDALKRAAVHFGIGRYLYRLPSQWVDYDPVKKQIVQVPRLPDWAVPGKQAGNYRTQPQKPSDGNGQPEREKVSTESTVVDETIVAYWKKFLAGEPNVEVLNASIKEVAKVGCKYTRRAVTRLFNDYAAHCSFEWDNSKSVFVAPVDVPQDDERIPF